MQQLFCSSHDVTSGKIVISDAGAVHHLKNVLRLKAGEEVSACDESGNIYSCCVESCGTKKIVLAIKRKQGSLKKPGLKITVACAIPKNSRFDDIIDKLTQIGVDRIIPMLTERVIVKLDKRKEALRLQRWQRVALSAAEQCHRSSLPEVSPVKSFSQVIEESAGGYGLKLIPALIGERKTLKQASGSCRSGSVLFLIGPEGDFTDKEIGRAIAAGFVPVSLGELILRVETAAIAVAGFLKLNEDV